MEKKLYLSSSSYDATIKELPDRKEIILYEDNKALFSIVRHHRAIKPNTIEFNNHLLVPIYVIELAMEVNKDFNIHFNYLKLQK